MGSKVISLTTSISPELIPESKPSCKKWSVSEVQSSLRQEIVGSFQQGRAIKLICSFLVSLRSCSDFHAEMVEIEKTGKSIDFGEAFGEGFARLAGFEKLCSCAVS